MKILQLISSGGLYGAEVVVKNLAVHLNRLGCDCRVGVFLNSHNPHLELAESMEREGVPVVVLPCRGRFDADTVRAIRRYVRSEGIDICNTHGYKADLFGLAATVGLRAALVTTRHTTVDEHQLIPGLRLYCIADNIAAQRFARVVAVSDAIASRLRRWGVSRAKLRVVANGTDLEAFDGAAPKFGPRCGQVVGYVGRLTEEKGAFDLVEAAARVLGAIPGLKLVMAGDGAGRQALESRIAELGILHAVELLGAVPHTEMASVYASMDVLALPSHGEGLPMCILEGMAAGCAVVASRVGAIPTVIEHGINGILVQPRDVGALAKELTQLLGETGRTASLAAHGQATVRERFSAQAMARQYLAAYAEVAS